MCQRLSMPLNPRVYQPINMIVTCEGVCAAREHQAVSSVLLGQTPGSNPDRPTHHAASDRGPAEPPFHSLYRTLSGCLGGLSEGWLGSISISRPTPELIKCCQSWLLLLPLNYGVQKVNGSWVCGPAALCGHGASLSHGERLRGYYCSAIPLSRCTQAGEVSELSSVSVSSGWAPSAIPSVLLGHIRLSTLREQTAEPGQVSRRRGQVPRGGVHVDDARGHAPTLGQTRKRRRRPLGKMAPSGLKAVVGESECRPRPGSASASPGGRGPGTQGLGGPGGGELGTDLGVEHLTLEGADGGLGSSWTSRLSRAGAEPSW